MSYYDELKSPKWQKKRLEIMKRDNFECQFCGNGEKQLKVHHIVYMPNTKLWEYDNELLITLCEEHHKEIHEMNKIFALVALDYIKNKTDLTVYSGPNVRNV